MNILRLICRSSLIKKKLTTFYRPPGNNRFSLFGISFENSIGLGAGFDKNALYLDELETLGFGFVEIGTVTPIAQAGNEKPRLFRLKKDKALINRMGFNNDGVAVISERLKNWRNTNSSLIIGGNIGKNKNTSNEDAWKDYETCFIALHNQVDYFVVNVSSPNTPGLRELQEKNMLSGILKNLQAVNERMDKQKPILLKIAPDLTKEQIDDVIDLSLEIKLDGLIISNTTISRQHLSSTKMVIDQAGAGGLSGLPVKKRSTELIRYVSSRTHNEINIIGSGGIFNGEDAIEKLDAGASLLQVWTGFVYEGPSIVKNISTYLAGRN